MVFTFFPSADLLFLITLISRHKFPEQNTFLYFTVSLMHFKIQAWVIISHCFDTFNTEKKMTVRFLFAMFQKNRVF